MTLRRARPYWNVKVSSVSTSFVFTVKTDNAGTSASDQFDLPLKENGTYNFTVDNWGDGTSDSITAWDDPAKTHTYPSAGTYTVTISGQIEEFRFNNSGDRLKILEIQNWGTGLVLRQIGGSDGSFNGCQNMDVTATDVPVFSGNAGGNTFRNNSSLIWNDSVNLMDISMFTANNGFFDLCSLFNRAINNLDLSNSTDNRNFLRGTSYNQTLDGLILKGSNESFLRLAGDFNQSLAGVDVTEATDLSRFCENTAFDINSYDPTLIAWDGLALQNNVAFHAGSAQYSAGAAATARQNIINDHNWTFTDGGQV